MIFQKTLPVGGGHIAADVAEGLNISLESAEQIKREYVYGISTISQSYTVTGGDGVKAGYLTPGQVAEVLEPRVDEIAEMIMNASATLRQKAGRLVQHLPDRRRPEPEPGRSGLSGGQLEKPVRDTVSPVPSSCPAPFTPAPWA